MNSFKTALISKSTIAEKTIEFNLLKPKDFSFQAGQHINIKLPQLLYDDNKGPRRTFTLSSSPDEKAIKITTRMSDSGFKKTLIDLPPDTELEFMGPMGNMTYIPDSPSLFIAGGIGITPFKSIISDLLHKKSLTIPVTLIYSNRLLKSAAFHEFFKGIKNPDFDYIPTITGDSNWAGETRSVDHEFLKNMLKNMNIYQYFLCGPPQMVQELTGTLNNLGVDQDKIHSESFFGY